MDDEQNSKEIFNFNLILYIISIVLFAISFVPIFEKYNIYICLLVIILSGYELLVKGFKNIFKFNFEEDTLMTIAIIAAFILGEFPESCMVILLFRLGEFLEDKAVDNSNKNIKNIVEIKANTANFIDDAGQITVLDVQKVKVGDLILIKPGEIVPFDCTIIQGQGSIDTSNITGESTPLFVCENSKLLSGSINLTGALKAKVEKDFKNSTASQIVDLVYEATNNKGKTEEFITKFSKVYTPIIIVLALFIAFLPPILLGQNVFKDWIMRALVFLVASCPCSIVISVPLAFFSCIGTISKKGMLIKGTKHIESLAKSNYIAFDKTGTITTGKMQIDKIVSINSMPENQILSYLYSIEKNSNHPISTAIMQYVENKGINSEYNVSKYEEIAGHGICCEIDNKQILFGNRKLLEKYNIITNNCIDNASYLAIDKNIEAYITFKEEIRTEAKNILSKFKSVNIKDVIMLTGDNDHNAQLIANEIGIKTVYANLLPKDKQDIVKDLKKKGNVIFIGDGINDSPVLATSSFGISMGEGTEIANNTADGILISNNISDIPKIIKIARKSMRIIKFNIAFSLIVKAVVLFLGILGIAPVWAAVVADTGVSLITIINSVRLLKAN